MALTFVLVEAQPGRLRYSVQNSSGGATTDTRTQAQMATDAVAGPIKDFMGVVQVNAAAWIIAISGDPSGASLQGRRVRVSLDPSTPVAAGLWSVFAGAGNGDLTISSSANATAFLNVEWLYDVNNHHWPPY